jgi:hypothetical protein
VNSCLVVVAAAAGKGEQHDLRQGQAQAQSASASLRASRIGGWRRVALEFTDCVLPSIAEKGRYLSTAIEVHKPANMSKSVAQLERTAGSRSICRGAARPGRRQGVSRVFPRQTAGLDPVRRNCCSMAAGAAARCGARRAPELSLDAVLERRCPGARKPCRLTILFEDDDLIVVDKPAGVVVHPGAGNTRRHAGQCPAGITGPELEHMPRGGIVHRLDKDTSGLLVVAATCALIAIWWTSCRRSPCAASILPSPAAPLTVVAPWMRRSDATRGSARAWRCVAQGGKDAVTHYRIAERFAHYTALDVQLETGAHAPDPRAYGAPEFPAARRPGLRRPAAVAPRLQRRRWPRRCGPFAARPCTRGASAFEHPGSGEAVQL